MQRERTTHIRSMPPIVRAEITMSISGQAVAA